ncbi:histidine phosphatase family protein [Clostridium taeniosporum]|uniref:Histidine phosphatase family protein n=1 Tax=Clostridium taeniosporum TaxID=394958 RepID=A0A1D7XMX5_9CLOT|nr:histidine phosphatase family protein [Clostridium taeniosporum]AOR24701.1 histidine phosphatase family protein [Clostridium taeniosporum]
MMTLFLTRHGETEWNIDRKLQGSQDSPLTERGLRQARSLRDRLKNEKIDVIYSSPTKRALDTAKIIAEANNTPIVTCDEFKEIGFGEYEGKYIKDLPIIGENNFLEEMFCGNHEIKGTNGETLLDVKNRSFKMLESILEKESDKNILIVTHGMALKVIMSYFTEFECELKGVYGQASLTKIVRDKDKFNILFKNDRSHTENL